MDGPIAAPVRESLEALIAGGPAVAQPPLGAAGPVDLTAAIASLALGGAERIVLDWARAASVKHRVRLIVLRDVEHEWPVPDGVT